jgi:hypothetical protein
MKYFNDPDIIRTMVCGGYKYVEQSTHFTENFSGQTTNPARSAFLHIPQSQCASIISCLSSCLSRLPLQMAPRL